MKKMLVLVLGAVVLALVNGCCSDVRKNCVCGVKDCVCDCDPCRMGWTHVRCFDSYKVKDIAVSEETKAEEAQNATENTNKIIEEAVEETKKEAQVTHVKIIPSYVEFVLEIGSLKGTKEIKEQPEKPITMTFTEKDGKIMVAGCSGVNRYFGNVKIVKENNEIKFDKMGSTMMMGPGMEAEQLFLKNLEKVAKYSVVDDKLSFMNANGEILAIFKLNK